MTFRHKNRRSSRRVHLWVMDDQNGRKIIGLQSVAKARLSAYLHEQWFWQCRMRLSHPTLSKSLFV
jgi:hypothetical protein